MNAAPGKGVRPWKTEAARRACIANARDLLAAADLLLSNDLPHLSFHMSTMALEEIGKGSLFRLSEMSDKGIDNPFFKRRIDDHVRKLFFAIWSPTFGKEAITKAQVEEYQGLAQRMHNVRLAGLYVDVDAAETVVPRQAVSPERARAQLGLALSRLEIEQATTYQEMGDAEREKLAWFLAATEDQEKRKFIFSRQSMAKLAESGTTLGWLNWLREEADRIEAEAVELTKLELARQEPPQEEAATPKWKLRGRIRSWSHSLRQKELVEWNRNDWVKLFVAGADKRELVIEIILPLQIPLTELWYAGLGAMNRVVVALNIGTLGQFWWYGPHLVDRFYESIDDLENSARIEVKRSPALQLFWGNRVLTAAELRNVALCFGEMPGPDRPDNSIPFNHYLSGLAFLGKTDIFIDFSVDAFAEFYFTLKEAMRLFGDWKADAPFQPSFVALLKELLGDSAEVDRFTEFGARVEETRLDRKALTLSEACAMKVLVDSYLIKQFRRAAQARGGRKGDEKVSGLNCPNDGGIDNQPDTLSAL